MKRYRVLSYDLDARATILSMDIKDGWEEKIKKQCLQNQKLVKKGLISEYGSYNIDEKIDRFVELGSSQISLIAFHNNFLRQIKSAYVIGSYYPALTGACALGERILNHLILRLREYFKSTSEYKKIYRKDSFDNWDLAINTLVAWEVLIPKAVSHFENLKVIRNKSIHFNPETDTNDKVLALEAIQILKEIINEQFSGFGTQPWYIPGISGASYLKKESETLPFISEIVLSNCQKVGHLHLLENGPQGWIVNDDHDYAEIEISDERFKELMNNRESYDAQNNKIQPIAKASTD